VDHTAARVTAITIERFRDRAVSDGASSEAIHAAIAALRGRSPDPTRWIVCCHPASRN
jgi:hypothetical protein